MAEINFGQNKTSPCDKFWCSKTNCNLIWTSEVHQRASNGFNLTALTWRLCIGANDSKISLIFGGKKNLDGIVLMRRTHGWSCSLLEVWGFPGRCRSNFSGRLGPLSPVSDLASPETGLQLPASAPVAISHSVHSYFEKTGLMLPIQVCECVSVPSGWRRVLTSHVSSPLLRSSFNTCHCVLLHPLLSHLLSSMFVSSQVSFLLL